MRDSWRMEAGMIEDCKREMIANLLWDVAKKKGQMRQAWI